MSCPTCDPRCELCDSRRVVTIRDGQPLCTPCALAQLTAEAELHEQAARYEVPARTPELTDAELAARCAQLRAEVRAELDAAIVRHPSSRPHPLPRGVIQAEARS